MKKSLLILSIVSLFLGMASCSSDDQEVEKKASFLKVSKSYIFFEATGGENSLDISSDGKWSIVNVPDWCSADILDGKNSATIKFTVSANKTSDDRDGIITLKADTIIRQITIAQDLKEASELSISNPILNFEAEGSSQTFEIKTDGRWAIEEFDANWLAFDQINGKKTKTIKVSLISNDAETDRQVKVIIRAGQLTHQLIIRQSYKKTTFLDLSVKELVFPVEGGDNIFEIRTDGFWTIKNMPAWCSSFVEKGNGTTKVKVTLKASSEDYPRTAEIQILSGAFTSKLLLKQGGVLASNTVRNTAGNLGKILKEMNLLENKSLVILGEMNDDDFSVLNKLVNLTDLNIKDVNIDKIPLNAFTSNKTLKSIVLPKNLVSIEDAAFAGCVGLEKIDIPESTKSIRNRAFTNTSLVNVTLPSGLIELGSAFSECTKLQTINIPTSIKIIKSGTFLDCINLKSITFPNDLIEIEQVAFYDCKGLKSIVIPNKVQIVGFKAFYGCTSLTSLTLGSSVKYLGDSCFGQSPLTTVRSLNPIQPNIGASCFTSNINTICTLYIPKGSRSNYCSPGGRGDWCPFWEIVEE